MNAWILKAGWTNSMSIKKAQKYSQKKYIQILLAFLLTAVIKTEAQLNKTLVSPLPAK